MIYFVFFILCIIPFTNYTSGQKSCSKYWTMAGLCISAMTVFAGFRDFGVGYDTNMYIDLYFNEAKYAHNIIEIFTSDKFSDFDSGYIFLGWIGNFISDKSQVLMILTEFYISIMLFVGIWFLQRNIRFSVSLFLFLYLITFFNTSLNEMRQHCAIMSSFAAFSLFLDKKYLSTTLLTVVAFCFHSSALVFLEFYLFYYIIELSKIKNKKLFLLFFIGIQLFVIISFYSILNIVGTMSIVRDVYMDRYDVGNYESNTLSKHYVILLIIYAYFVYKMIKSKQYEESKIFMFVAVTFCWFTYYSLSIYVIYLLRLAEYFQLIMTFYLAHILSSKKFKIEKYTYLVFAIYVWYIMYIVSNNSSTYPYSSTILGI